MRTVFDTNIFISAFAIPGGNAERAYRQALRGQFELATSIAILTEASRVLKIKFDWSDDKISRLLRSISKVAKVIKPTVHLDVLKDEPDNRILECTIEAEADSVVTGDRDLLSLGSYEGISIIRLAEFLALLQSTSQNL